MTFVFLIWLGDFIGNAKFGLQLAVTISSIGFVVLGLHFLRSLEENADPKLIKSPKSIKRSFYASIVLGLLISVLPSEKTYYAMLAAYSVNEIAQLEEVREVGSKSFEVLNKFLDEYLEEGETK